MKLEASVHSAEVVGKVVSQTVGIADPAMMIEHMVTTIYKNKKRIIVQEIASNCRDAHREVKTPDRPISIKLPNRFSTTLEFRDFGPGLSPDRIQNIYLNVGASTKRTDNTQTGGFGIGSKTPWSYTDVFTIRTITEENGKLYARSYSAIHGEHMFQVIELGEAILIDKSDPNTPEADKHTGTTVIIDVPNKDDWRYFAEYATAVTQWWDVRPEITGQDPAPKWAEYQPVYQGKNWKILSTNGSYYRQAEHTLCIDGIPYPLDINALEKCPSELQHLTQCGLVLFFGVGELSVALNREELQYTPKTQDAVIGRLQEIHKELIAIVEAEISKSKTYVEAVVAFRKMVKQMGHSLVKTATWNGIEIDGQDPELHHGGDVRTYAKIQTVAGMKLKARRDYRIKIADEKNLIVLNDCDSHSPLKLHQLFDTHPNIETVQLVTFGWDVTNATGKADKDKWIKENNWNLLTTISFASIPKKKLVVNGGIKLPKHNAKGFKFNGGHGRNAWTPDEVLDLKNGAGYYVTVSHGFSQDFEQRHIAKAMTLLGISEVYGVYERHVDKLGKGWVRLTDKVKAELETEKKSCNVGEYATWYRYQNKTLQQENSSLNRIMEIVMNEKLLDNPTTNILAKWYVMNKEVEDLKTKSDKAAAKIQRFKALSNLLDGSASIDTTQGAIINQEWEDISTRCMTAYPLMAVSRHLYHSDLQTLAREFAFYINAREKENGLTVKAVSV
jgi:hypothetical protein